MYYPPGTGWILAFLSFPLAYHLAYNSLTNYSNASFSINIITLIIFLSKIIQRTSFVQWEKE